MAIPQDDTLALPLRYYLNYGRTLDNHQESQGAARLTVGAARARNLPQAENRDRVVVCQGASVT